MHRHLKMGTIGKLFSEPKQKKGKSSAPFIDSLPLRMSLSGDTDSTTALLRSLLAFSSLHRYGMQSQALELKVSALEALSASGGTNIDKVKLVHHIATGMLLMP